MNESTKDNFVQTAGIKGIEKFEEIFNIKPSQEDTLEFRRQRLLNRFSLTPPFSTPFLRNKLNTLIKDYNLYIDYENYTIYLESLAENQSWFNEIFVTINEIKPCHMVFVSKALLINYLLINSEISYDILKYNYKLNSSWKLGTTPFASFLGGEILKMRDVKSFTKPFLTEVKDKITKEVHKILINNDLEIFDFTKKEAGQIEYQIPVTENNLIVTNIKMFDVNNLLIEDVNVYVEIGESSKIIKHNIGLINGATI